MQVVSQLIKHHEDFDLLGVAPPDWKHDNERGLSAVEDRDPRVREICGVRKFRIRVFS
jgi:hypothetical protein